MFPSTVAGMGHVRRLARHRKPIASAGGATHRCHGLRSPLIAGALRMRLPLATLDRRRPLRRRSPGWMHLAARSATMGRTDSPTHPKPASCHRA